MIPSEPSSSARVWITDGSPIPFSDVRTLDVDHRGLLGLHFPYKGLIDPCVPRGAATIAAAGPDDVLVAEAEWAVLFPGGAARHVAEPGRVAATMRMRLLPIPNPLNLLPARRFALMEQTVRGILEDGLGALPDAPITVAVHDGQGTRVGEGTLTWRPVGG
ncbi:MAG TPA: hypothetical protein PK929_13530 [Quisquiliibacterium sp.]|nr:hypothetical protein [Quisquiliibacterium sp.]